MSSQESVQAIPAPKVGRDLPMAIGVGLGLLAALAVGLLWAPWFFVLISAASLSMAVVEVHQALLRKGMHAQVKTIVAGTLVSVLGAYAMFRWNLGLPPTTFAVICVCGTVIACLVARLLLARHCRQRIDHRLHPADGSFHTVDDGRTRRNPADHRGGGLRGGLRYRCVRRR